MLGLLFVDVLLVSLALDMTTPSASIVDMMAVKRETGGRDGAGEPAHPDQLSYSTSPDPNIALPFPKVIPYPGDTLFPEVPEVSLAPMRPCQC